MSNKYIVLILILFFIPFASSQIETLGGIDGYEPNTAIDLVQTCSNCTFINITGIKLGNGTIIQYLPHIRMTKTGTFYNYTLPATQTSTLGEYIINMLGNPDGLLTVVAYNLYVRNNATFLTTAESILYLGLVTLLLAFSILLLYFGAILPYGEKKNPDGTITRWIASKYFKVLCLWIGYGFFLLFFNVLTGVTNNFISLALTYNIISNIYVFLLILSYPINIVAMSALLIQFYVDMLIPMFKWFIKISKDRKNGRGTKQQ